MVRAEGLEPPRLSPLEPKSSASTNSATPARPLSVNSIPQFARAASALTRSIFDQRSGSCQRGANRTSYKNKSCTQKSNGHHFKKSNQIVRFGCDWQYTAHKAPPRLRGNGLRNSRQG